MPAPAPPAAAPPPAPAEPPSVVAPRFDAAYLNNPAPVYPAAARRRGEHGRVQLRVYVSAAGAAEKVELFRTSGSGALDAAAREAVERWRFVPARQGERPVGAWVIVPIVFTFEG
ncbi:MAG: energy transducer TonB [Betaproteobacteria bacterium]|nr:energy transducer TonB [Betaproteobacteria bacterium]